MYFKIIFFAILLQGVYVKAIDLNSLLGRYHCFDNVEENCNRTFLEDYPHLSRSVTNMTAADTFMLLFTRHLQEPEKLHLCAGRLPPKTKFDPENEVIVIFMPFFFSYCNVAIFREWVAQLLMRGDYNIIVIDYSWGNQLDYGATVLNIRSIVKYQAVILLDNIQDQIGVPFVHLTLIGQSLGAQLAGLVGALYSVDRIIGLDPSGPGFAKNETDLDDRLDPSDAKLVEVWHSNAGDCLPNSGINYEAGHVNFYINGGSVQNSCYKYAFTSFWKGDYYYGISSFLFPPACWHNQCTQYFKVSINPGSCQFVGVRCRSKSDYELGKCKSCGASGENCLVMGFDTEKYIQRIPSEPEIYFVETSEDCPYCDNKHVELSGYNDILHASLQSC